MNKALIITLILLSFVFTLDYSKLNEATQKHSKAYINESLLLATSTYATSRVINAGVSTLQESTITMSPFGMGITVPPGQILDPINDATERLSDLCVQSIGLLGVQRLLLEVINRFTLIPLYSALAFFLVLSRFTKQRKFSVMLLKFVLLLALLRISTPIMCSLGTAANEHYFKPSIEQSLTNLSGAKDIVTTEFNDEESDLGTDWPEEEEELGVMETIKSFFAQISVTVRQQFAGIKSRFNKTQEAIVFLKEHSLLIVNDLTNLFAAILGKIAVQVFLLPLATLALIRWIFKQITEASLDELAASIQSKIRSDRSLSTEEIANT